MAAPTFFGVATNPADNGTLAEPQTAVVITPPASMQTGDLCIAIAYMMAGTAYPGLNATGGQTWNTDTTNFQFQGSTAYHKIWWARFNGTWSTNPSWSFASQAGTQAVGVQMLVFRPDSTSKLWYVANEPSWSSFTAPTTPFTITIPGTDLIKTDTVTLARWYSDDDNTYGSLSGANWSKTGLAAQYRNLAGSDNSVSFAYQLNGAPVSTGDVSQNQATLGGDAGAILSLTFYATAGAPQSVTQGAQLQDADTFYALEKTNFRLNQSKYFDDQAVTLLPITIDNPNAYSTSANDYFGYSVAISDSYAIVGAYLEDDAGGTQSGKAYIFHTANGALAYTLNNPNAYSTSVNDNFGRSVAISDSYAIVGAFLEDDAGGINSGKAYIFHTANGALAHTLDNPNAYDTSLEDRFGISVDISNSYAIVGAFLEDDAGGTQSGKAYIFHTANGSLAYTLDNPNAYDTSVNDYFGYSVAISDSYAIVGAYREGDVGGIESGKAYVYYTANGALAYTLDNPNAYDTSANDNFGISVDISDSYAIVGAYREDDAGGGINSGKAYIFHTANGSLAYTLDNPNASGISDQFGYSVSISDSYAIVGAYLEDDAGGINSGKAYVYRISNSELLYTLDNPNAYDTSANDFFGFSVAISDSYAIVGAYNEDDAGGISSGKAYLYDLNNVYGSSPSTFQYSIRTRRSVTRP
jgi:hypothetical protein